MATQEPTDSEQSTESEQTVIQNIYPEELLLIRYEDIIRKSSINDYYTIENSIPCENRLEKNDCEHPDIFLGISDKFLFGDDPTHKWDNDKLLGWDKIEANKNTQDFFKKFSEKHGLEMNKQESMNLIEVGKNIEMIWGEKQKYIEEYANNLLFNLKQNRDFLNQNRDEYDKIPEVLDSVNVYKARGKMEELRDLISKYSYSHGQKHNTLYNCVWEENEDGFGSCINYIEDEEEPVIEEKEEKKCDKKTFDKKIVEIGGIKITLGLILIGVIIKFYMENGNLKKKLSGIK